MKVKHTILILALFLAFNSLTFGQTATTSATYTLGNIKADRSFGNPTQSSACPGTLAVNIPAGSVITSVDVVYDFEALPGSYKAFQISQLRCVSPGGLPEGSVAKSTSYTSGVLTYSRPNLTIANEVVGGGNILFELHAGNTFGTVQGCSEQFLRINNNTWTVTVHYLPPAFPDPPSNPSPADSSAGVSINAGNISWNFGNNTSYYDLYFGTEKPLTNKVVDNQVAGATGNYTFGTLPSGTRYFWQVVVRNEAGLELAGPLWNFSTECLLTNTPVIENFDKLEVNAYGSGAPTENIPLCWTMLYQNAAWYASAGVYSTPNAFSAPNCWIMSNEGDPVAYNLMILPEVTAAVPALQLSLMAKGTGGLVVLSVGTMSDNNNLATFTEFTTITLSTVYQQFDIPFSSYSGTDQHIAVKYASPGPNIYHYIYLDNVLLSEIPTCPRPGNLSVLEATQTTATVNWIEQGTATQWNVEVVPAGTAPIGNFTTTTTKPFTFEGLAPFTNYEFYVQSDCGGNSLSYWSNQGTFKTACLPVSVPLFENFDASTAFPACWTIYKTPNGSVQIGTYSSYSAPNHLKMNVASIINDIAMVISPPLIVPGGMKELKLTFYAQRTAFDQSVIVGTISNPLEPSTFTPVQSILPPTSNQWGLYEVWFNNYEGSDNYIAFKCGNLTNVGTIAIDNITFGLQPNCINPVNLFVNEITETNARLNFTESREATKWHIELGPVGFVPGTGTNTHAYTYEFDGNNYSYVMTGLTAATFYDVYMRADCGGGDLSLWSPKARFMSQPELFSPLPFYETFDPESIFTVNPPTNNVNWSLFTTLYTSAPNSIRNQYGSSNNNVLVISKRFDLTGKTNAYLSFWHIAKTQANRDHCYVEISTDGGANFDQLPLETYLGIGKYTVPTQNLPDGPCFNEASYSDWGTGTETPVNTWWKNENFDLSAYSGSNNVVIRLRLFSDSGTNKYGWLIDDFSIKTYTEAIAEINPVNIDVELQSGETTNETLTITNSGDLPLLYTASVQNYSDAMTTLVYQEFETGVPTDWTIINGTESSPVSQWQWFQPTTQYFMNGTNFMFVGRSYPDTCSETLISPAFDGTGYSNVYLNFDYVYVKAASGSAPDYAEVFVWDGSAWHSVLYMKSANAGAWGNPAKPVFDITQYANPEMKVKFYYDGYSTSRWGVDNFKITASDIPLDWLTLNGKTTIQGLVQPGTTENINVGFQARTSFPDGKWTSEIQIVSNDPDNSPVIVPVSMTIGCLQPWTYIQPGLTHTISIPTNVVPEIFGEPLANGDWIGVFYLDGNSEEACGGAVQWNSGGVGITVFGNDQTTPEKDGFNTGEAFRWRLKKCGAAEQYSAVATYDATMPNQGNFAGFGLSKLTSLQTALMQNFTLNQGWNSISSYIVPSNPAVENMFASLADDLIILKNLSSFYYPAQGTNTIGNWNSQSGYVVKVAENSDLVITGANYVNNTITLQAGWQYLPVLSQCATGVMDVFGSNLNNIIIIQELIGTRVFWPAMQIYSLETFEPGKAYLIKLANQITVSFPECQAKDSGNTASQLNSLQTPWGTLNLTPVSQIALFMPEALTNFVEGDIIGAFDQNGNNFGYCTVSDKDKNLTMTLFGDDNTSLEKDGFVNNEPIRFKVMRASTSQEFDITVEYSKVLENTSGNFIEGSFAAISGVKMSTTGIGDSSTSAISIFPNPTNGILNITGVNGKSAVHIFNVFGEEVYLTELTNSSAINVGSLAKGTYVLRVSNENENTFKKLVIR